MRIRDRTRARQLAAEFIQKGQPTGWFEALYKEAEEGKSTVPWADREPNPHLLAFWNSHPQKTEGKLALVVGCGLGDDAEQLREWGFRTTAFDISETAIRGARKRFSESPVEYVAADLFQLPHEWNGRFDFVFEAYTLQSLPATLRDAAMKKIVSALRPGGRLLVVARAREPEEPQGQMPWPLTRPELERFKRLGLEEIYFEDWLDPEDATERRFRVLYKKTEL